MKKPQGYPYLAAVNPAVEIGVSNYASGHTAKQAVFLCPNKHGRLSMGGLCGAAKAAPLLASGTPTRTVPLTLIGVGVVVTSTIARDQTMQLSIRDTRKIQSALTLIEKTYTEQNAPAFESTQAAATYARLKIGRLEREEFHAFWLDNKHRLIAPEILSIGTIDRSNVYIREVAKSALSFNAAAVIFAHNHPSGDCTPSHADKQITKKLLEVLAIFDVRVIDHLIVSRRSYLRLWGMK